MKTKEEIRIAIGDPNELRGSVINVDGDRVDVWQYNLYEKNSGWLNLAFGLFFIGIPWFYPNWVWVERDSYWLYFVNDSLVQWGRAGDWQPDVLMDIRLKMDN